MPLWWCQLSTPSDDWLKSLTEFQPSITAADPDDDIVNTLKCQHGDSTFSCDLDPCAGERKERNAARAKTDADVAYEELKRREQAKERYRRERLEESFDGKLTEAQEAKLSRIETQIMTREQLAELPRPEPLIAGLLFHDSLAWVAGESGSYKSFVTLDMAARFADEEMDYHGLDMTHGRALIVVGEGNSAYIDRVQAWEKYNRRPWPLDAHFHNGAVQLGDRDSVAALCALAKRREYGLVIFDTQAMMTVGVEENSSTEMGVVMNAMHAMREATGACILTVHHFGKSTDNMRGSGAIYAAATTVITTDREGMQVVLSTKHSDNGKQKDSKEESYVPFVVSEVKVSGTGIDDSEDDRWSLVITSPMKLDDERRATVVLPTLERQWTVPVLMALIDKPVFGGSAAQISAWLVEQGHTSANKGTIHAELNKLVKEKLIMGPKGALKVTDMAREALAERGFRTALEESNS